ncbi:MAG: 5-formyltetrahydrofolate cyclo-ligase [Thermodesulfobacteriota bacterium]
MEWGQNQKKRERRLSNNCVSEGVRSSLPNLLGEDDGIPIVKARIRREFLKARLCLSEDEVDKKSELISNFLIQLPLYKLAKSIALYFPTKNEVDTSRIFKNATESGKKVYYPRVDGYFLSFHEVDSKESLKSGYFGIPEPNENSPSILTEDLDLVTIPGLVFNLSGGRIGYGKGYYDRSTKLLNREKRIALAYSFQIQDSIPVSKFDIGMGYLITELGIVSCAGGDGGT